MAKAANTTNPSTVHDLPPGSAPGARAPGFTPILGREFVMAYPPVHMARSPEERLLDLNARYDRVLKFYDAAWDAYDVTHDKDLKEEFNIATGHAIRMLSEIEEQAYIIPATTIRTIALKARIMSEAKKTWWDASAEDADRDARVLIEDILALAGMDRIHPRSFEFSDLLKGYDGPKLFEAAATHPFPGSADVRLATIADELCDIDRRADASDPETTPGYDALIGQYRTLESELERLPADTLAGIRAKMRASRVPGVAGCVNAIDESILRDLSRLLTKPAASEPIKVYSTPSAAPGRSSTFWTDAAGDGDYENATHPEGALIQFAGTVASLREQEHSAWTISSTLTDDATRLRQQRGPFDAEDADGFDGADREVGLPAAQAVASSLSAVLLNALRKLAQQPARTPEGLAAKAAILVAIDDWMQDGFGELALSVAKDAVWIGKQSRFRISHLDAMLKDGRSAARVAA